MILRCKLRVIGEEMGVAYFKVLHQRLLLDKFLYAVRKYSKIWL
jgi:hypothetical protein